MEILNSMSGYALALILFLALIAAYIELRKKDKYIEYLEISSVKISDKPVIIPNTGKDSDYKNKIQIKIDKDFIRIYPSK